MGVTTIALIDTDSDPDPVDLPIPGNDDSIRSIEVILAKIADACLEGRAALPPEQQAMMKPRQPAARDPPRPRPPPPAEPGPRRTRQLSSGQFSVVSSQSSVCSGQSDNRPRWPAFLTVS